MPDQSPCRPVWLPPWWRPAQLPAVLNTANFPRQTSSASCARFLVGEWATRVRCELHGGMTPTRHDDPCLDASSNEIPSAFLSEPAQVVENLPVQPYSLRRKPRCVPSRMTYHRWPNNEWLPAFRWRNAASTRHCRSSICQHSPGCGFQLPLRMSAPKNEANQRNGKLRPRCARPPAADR